MQILTTLFMLVSFFAVTGNVYAGTGKVDVCHKGQTINISSSAKQAHLNHGDRGVACEMVPQAAALFQCSGKSLTILSISTSFGVPESPSGPIAIGDSCSASISILMSNGFKLLHANTLYDDTSKDMITNYGYTGPRVMPTP